MNALGKQRVCIFVDRASQQWIVRDPDGRLWIVPLADDAWEQRQPFTPTDDSELELIPGHYRYMLNLTF